MSAIDQYKHKIILAFECPSTFPFIYRNKNSRTIVIYQLLEDVPDDEVSFDGKNGDLIIGGGKGEADSMRLSTQKALMFFSDNDSEKLEYTSISDIFKTFWSNNSAYIYCDGYKKLGWQIEQNIDYWLAENICKLLVHETEEFKKYREKYSEKSILNSVKI